jgi:hypothetical protein
VQTAETAGGKKEGGPWLPPVSAMRVAPGVTCDAPSGVMCEATPGMVGSGYAVGLLLGDAKLSGLCLGAWA